MTLNKISGYMLEEGAGGGGGTGGGEIIIQSEIFYSVANQQDFTLTKGSYLIGANRLEIFINNDRVALGGGFQETSPTTFKILTPIGGGTKIEARWFESISGNLIPGGIVEEVAQLKSKLQNLGYINIKDLGAKGDATLVPKDYTVGGVVYKGFEWSGTDNSAIIQVALDMGVNVYIPEGKYYCASKVTITKGNIKVFGDGKYKSSIINANVELKDVRGVHITGIGIIGKGDKKAPPVPLTANASSSAGMNYMEAHLLGYNGPGISILVPSAEGKLGDITIENCYFSMRSSGVEMSRRDDGTGVYADNLKVLNCDTDHIWWHGVGSRYCKGVIVSNCNFKNHWVGLACDFSSGTYGSILSDSYIENVSCLFKNETYSEGVGVNYNCIISGNTYISCSASDYNYKQYIGKSTGNNTLITDNKILARDTMTSIFEVRARNTIIQSNMIEVSGQVGNVCMLSAQSGVDGDLVFRDNSVYVTNTDNTTSLVKTYAKSDTIIISNTTVTGNTILKSIFTPLQDSSVNTLVIEGNSAIVNYMMEFNLKATLGNVTVKNNQIKFRSASYFLSLGSTSIRKLVIKDNQYEPVPPYLPDSTKRSYFIRSSSAEPINHAVISGNYCKGIGEEFIYLYQVSVSQPFNLDYIVISDNICIHEGLTANGISIYLDITGTGILRNNTIIGTNLLGGDALERTKVIELKNKIVSQSNSFIGKYSIRNILGLDQSVTPYSGMIAVSQGQLQWHDGQSWKSSSPDTGSLVTQLPVASESYRSKIYTLQGTAGQADRSFICKKLANDTYEWVEI
ncbi:hypothetical protein HSE3_gp089 [Bacillus phage vB_BceM-HSE3]|nr:hypothetical protein HSE3_gp089 [Bacillus phage vB_BceM-HSE3]